MLASNVTRCAVPHQLTLAGQRFFLPHTRSPYSVKGSSYDTRYSGLYLSTPKAE